MKDLIDRVTKLNADASQEDVDKLIKHIDKWFDSSPSIATLEEVVKHYKAEDRKIRTKDLLSWMNENEQTEFSNDNVSVKIKTSVSAKMINSQEGFLWLTKHGYGNSILDKLEFPRGELTAKDEKAIVDMGLSFVKKSGIYPASLKAIMAARLKAGEMLPDWAEDDPGDGIKIGYFDECVVKEK